MTENTATYKILIENENHSLTHPFQRKIRSTEIRAVAGSDVEEDLDPLDARERRNGPTAIFMSEQSSDP